MEVLEKRRVKGWNFILIKNIYKNFKIPQRAKTVLTRVRKDGGVTLPNFKAYSISVMSQTARHWLQNRPVERNRVVRHHPVRLQKIHIKESSGSVPP